MTQKGARAGARTTKRAKGTTTGQVKAARQPKRGNRYTYRTTWSAEDQEFVGLCAEFPSLSHLAETPSGAFEGILALVSDVLADMQASGEKPPEPLAARKFSGEFKVRIPSELHRRLTIEAAEANVSMNRIVSMKLAQV